MRGYKVAQKQQPSTFHSLNCFPCPLLLLILASPRPPPQEDYIKDEMKNLKREMIRAKEVLLGLGEGVQGGVGLAGCVRIL